MIDIKTYYKERLVSAEQELLALQEDYDKSKDNIERLKILDYMSELEGEIVEMQEILAKQSQTEQINELK